ncbi:hypothetical protein CAPTEDRAFT_197833 [Capitella teleta]|uniref:Uncharacterized protein n=1 Tax=Capitella teleta TaxID=283909 RepID=R7T340_CAPTE|nr:hypothetical protein CAPTEDRAFT_197833 [Capitella teleta]|eukprot:ELT87057.1 hypothetical protein CAPTEDRAFT_197833 [Capitella teleta]
MRPVLLFLLPLIIAAIFPPAETTNDVTEGYLDTKDEATVPTASIMPLIDGVPIDLIPDEFLRLLLLGINSELEDFDFHTNYCTTSACREILEEYEKWREENGYGKSEIRYISVVG